MSPRPRLSDEAREARRRQIVDGARRIAEERGWGEVTTRALATRLGCSQPTIYQHFATMDGVRDAVAVDGFAELAEALREASQAARRGDRPRTSMLQSRVVLEAVATAYLDFARERPALFAAMFVERSALPFGTAETSAPLRERFGVIAAAIPASGGDRETITELVWSALHGLAVLESRGRLRSAKRRERTDALVALFVPGSPAG